MTVYARSDLAYVYVSGAHGGCLEGHSRPVENGAPAKVWPLDCPMCEDHLRSDPHWATSITDIPETYDEVKARESLEKRSAQNSNDLTALMLAVLAGDKQAEALQRELIARRGGAALEAPAEEAAALCPDGHRNRAEARFCSECGARMGEAPAATPAPSVPSAEASQGDLASLHPQKLAKKCRDAGLNDKGSKAELVARLQAHARRVPGAV